MIALSATARGTKELSKLLEGDAKKLKRELSIAVNNTAKATVGTWSKAVSKEVAIAQKHVKPTIKVTKKAAGFFSTTPSATVAQKKWRRIPLRDFAAKETSKGVRYRIEKGGKRPLLPGGFMVKSLGNHVFARVGEKVKPTKGRYAGTKSLRQKIDKKYGPSPWGVSIKHDIKGDLLQPTEAKLLAEMYERIRLIKLRKKGLVR